jgi:hypothetical protein
VFNGPEDAYNTIESPDYTLMKTYQSSKSNFKTYKQIDLTPYENRYCIYWYRYNKNYIPPTSEGGIMPMGWERIPSCNNCGLPIADGPQLSEKDGKPYYAAKPVLDAGVFECYMSETSTEEKFVAVLFYNHDRIQSRELVFTNADVVPDKTTLDKGDILIFDHVSESYDSY